MPTLEEIERNIKALQAKLPAIETGIKQLSSASTPADLGVLSLYSPNVEYETARKEYEKTFPTEIPDSEKIRSDTMAQFQAEIDALTKIQAEKSAEIQEKYKTIGKERAGKTRALLARAGMLGQVSGFGQQQEVETATEAEKQAALEKVGAEYGGLIAGLRGEARRLAQDEYNRRYEAARQGAEAKLEEIRTRPERAQVAISNIAKKALALGIDLEKDTNTLNATLKDLSSGGLTATANDILSVYKSEKSAMEAEQEKEALEMEKTKAEIEKLKREPTKTQTGGFSSIPATQENQSLISAFQMAVSNASKPEREYRIQVFNDFVNSGNIEQAKEFILQTAMETADTDTYKTVTGRMDSIKALEDIQSLLNEAKNAGVSTNFLRGKAEDIARKFGETTDPRLVDIGNRINFAMFLYRKAMTGVQFGYAESGQYEKIFPNYKNEPPVNEAAIKSLIDSMNLFNDSFFERKLGLNNYRNLFGKSQESSLREQVIKKGYDYDKLKTEGYSDEEIRQAVGL